DRGQALAPIPEPIRQALMLGLPGPVARLPDRVRDRMFERARLYSVGRNETLVEIGQANPPVFAVRSGVLMVSHRAHGELKVVTDFLRGREGFGPVLREAISSSVGVKSVVASSVLGLPMLAFREVIREVPDFAQWLVEWLHYRRELNYALRP